MILPLPPRPLNDNQQDALYVCPHCSNTAFILQSAPGDTILVKCGKCFADCTVAVALQIAAPVGKEHPCQP